MSVACSSMVSSAGLAWYVNDARHADTVAQALGADFYRLSLLTSRASDCNCDDNLCKWRR